MTPERITEVRKILAGMNQSSQLFPITVGDLNSLLADLEETEKERDKANEVLCDKMDDIAEAQQTIARQREVFEEYAKEENWFKAFDHEGDAIGLVYVGKGEVRDISRAILKGES